MGFFPLTAVAKTFNTQSSQPNMRQTGLGISAAVDGVIDDASTDAMLASMGGGTTGIAVFKDTTAAAARTEISAGVGYTISAKDTGDSPVTGVDANLYECDTSGGVLTINLPAVTANAKIGIKLVTAGNNLTVGRNGVETIDGAASDDTLSVAGETVEYRANAAVNGWVRM